MVITFWYHVNVIYASINNWEKWTHSPGTNRTISCWVGCGKWMWTSSGAEPARHRAWQQE
jgi:hypothetical protein